MLERTLAAAVLLAMPLSALAADADPVAIFDQAPAPPASLAAAKAAVRVRKGGSNPELRAPAYDAVLEAVDRNAKNAGMRSTQQQMDEGGVGVDVQRLQSDPEYARRFQAKMAAMSTAEKMAMVQRMQSAQRAAAMSQVSRGGHAAQGGAAAGLAAGAGADRRTTERLARDLGAALKAGDELHAAVDAEIDARAKSCPADKTGWPLASCTGPLGRKGVEEHRAAEARALARENAAYRRARAEAKPRVDALAGMMSGARQSGLLSEAASVSANIDLYTQVLAEYALKVARRAGFWSGAVSSKFGGRMGYLIPLNAGRAIDWPLADSR
ncbi:MAG TPA: hypothetical protein VH309_01740 [Elusimicrobiota bacterium]|nr:hypothetical protein [Elusimicrobiota bacterium]